MRKLLYVICFVVVIAVFCALLYICNDRENRMLVEMANISALSLASNIQILDISRRNSITLDKNIGEVVENKVAEEISRLSVINIDIRELNGNAEIGICDAMKYFQVNDFRYIRDNDALYSIAKMHLPYLLQYGDYFSIKNGWDECRKKVELKIGR